MSTDLIAYDEHETGKRGHRGASGKTRARQVVLVLAVALLGLPVLALVLRFLIALSPDVIGLVIFAVAILIGVALPAMAWAYGFKVTRRTPLVVWHVIATLEVTAFWLSLTLGLSWENRTGEWYMRLLDVAVVPVWWWALHIIGSLTVAGSWLLTQTNALRAAAKGGSDGGWQELFGAKGVKPRLAEAVVTDTAIEVPLDHPGVPLGSFRTQAIAKIDDKPGVFAGGTTIVRDGKMGGRAKLRITTADPFDPSRWDWWPGPSHPGGTYEAPICTAKYDTGDYQWMSFAATPEGAKFVPAAPYAGSENFASPNGTFVGRQGMTGAGKSGDACIEEAEVLSRRDVVLVHIAPAKLRQNAGWLLDMATLAAEGDRIQILFRGLQKLGEYRDTVDIGRDFDSQIAAETGRPWVHIFADEFDIVKQGSTLGWLLTKGRSLGFRFSFTLPRGTSKNMDTDIRGSIGCWKQFGISQDYDSSFVISEETLDAGAKPEQWGATTPGAHYLDKAPGVDKALYARPARTFRTRRDYADLRSKTLAARAQFTPATFPQDELDVLGEVMEICNPLRYLDGPSEPIRVDAQVSREMEDTLDLDELDDMEGPIVTDDDDLNEVLANLPPLEVPEGIDPREPLVAADDTVGETLATSVNGKTMPPDKAAAEAELDAAITRLAIAGKVQVTNKEIQEEMKYLFNPTATSRRMKELLDPESPEVVHQPAPGVLIQRVTGRPGTYLLKRL